MKIKVGVIFGGCTVEHEVSIISAVQAMNNIDEEKYDVVPIYISKDRIWYTGALLKDIEIYKDLDLLKRYATQVTLCKKNNEFYLIKTNGLFNKEVEQIDIAFPIVHGNNAEEAKQDLEGLQTMRNLAKNMVYILKCIKNAEENGIPKPQYEEKIKTNFIR